MQTVRPRKRKVATVRGSGGRKNAKPQPVRAGLSRESILDAALEILNEGGMAALSLRSIVKRLGCSVAGPYTYFAGQDEIISTLIQKGEEELTGDLKRAGQKGGDLFEILRRLAATYMTFARRNRELHKLMFNINGHKRIFPSATASYRAYIETIRGGVKSSRLHFSRKGYHAIARTMWAWLYGLIVLEMTGVTTMNADEAIDEGFSFFQRLLEQGEKSA